MPKPEKVEALEQVSGTRFISRRYIYRTESGRHFITPHVIHGIPDERPYEIAHPKLDKFHKGCQRWNSSMGLVLMGAGAASKLQGKPLF